MLVQQGEGGGGHKVNYIIHCYAHPPLLPGNRSQKGEGEGDVTASQYSTYEV